MCTRYHKNTNLYMYYQFSEVKGKNILMTIFARNKVQCKSLSASLICK
jgi:hypothetical protein